MIPILVIVPSNTKIVVVSVPPPPSPNHHHHKQPIPHTIVPQVTPIPGGFGISPVLTVGEVCNWPANKPGPAFEAAVAGGVAEMYAYVQKRLDAARE